jgi:hypothetical protein
MADHVGEQCAEENIWTYEGESIKRIQKIA